MRILLSYSFAAFFLLSACSQHSGTGKMQSKTSMPLDSLLPGTWQHEKMQVWVNDLAPDDSSYLLTIEGEDWQKKLQIQPTEVTFLPDHKFQRQTKDLEEVTKDSAKGIWNVFGDTSLLFVERNATYQYQVQRLGDKLQLQTNLDWDGDGQEDDSYLLIMRKL